MNIKDFIGSLLRKGLRIGFSTGKMFDPTDQERTDAVKDLVKQDEEKTKTMLDKMFQPVKKKED